MRIGLVGYGAWGAQHAAAIAGTPGTQLAWIAAPSETSRAKAAAAYPEARLAADYREMLADPGIDMIDVVAPNHLHEEIGCAALAAGKHVLMEKPLATTLAGCDRLISAERASGKRISVGHELRLSDQWGLIKRDIDAGRIGAPRHATITLFRNAYRPGADGWRFDPARVGSWTLEETVHFFDLALWYLAASGPPCAVRATAPQVDPETGLSQTISAMLFFPDGASAVLTHSTGGFGHNLTAEIIGAEGAIRAVWQGVMDRDLHPTFDYRIRPRDFRFERGVSEFETPELAASGEVVELEAQIAAVVDAFRQGETIVSAAEARRSVAVCLAAEESARSGREIEIAG